LNIANDTSCGLNKRLYLLIIANNLVNEFLIDFIKDGYYFESLILKNKNFFEQKPTFILFSFLSPLHLIEPTLF